MEQSVKTQLEIKNNAEDVQRFIAEMKTWEKEIKDKEEKLKGATQNKVIPAPRNVAKKRQPELASGKEKKKIAGSDYRAWDKFDVEKACKDIDGQSNEDSSDDSCSNSDPDLPPMKKISPTPLNPIKSELKNLPVDVIKDEKAEILKNIDLAHFEKELGNKYVREEKWKEAIECYSKAIDLDSKNPIYYANRALCNIKLSNFKVAEVDSTVALQLDKSYVKAYQRRAFARKAMQQFDGAKDDYMQVLLLEPKNALARTEIIKIDDYLAKTENIRLETDSKKPTFNPKNIFTTSVSQDKSVKLNEIATTTKKNKPISTNAMQMEKGNSNEPNREEKNGVNAKENKTISQCTIFESLPEGSVIISPVEKAAHLRSKKPLKKIEIRQVERYLGVDSLLPKSALIAETNRLRDAAEVKVVDSTPITQADESSDKIKLPSVPQTCVQFELAWKTVKNHDELCYQFLKSIPIKQLPSVFGSSLESSLLSQLVSALASDRCLRDPKFVYMFLSSLAAVERFNSLVMFMTSEDNKGLEKCCSSLSKVCSPDEILQLRSLYDLS